MRATRQDKGCRVIHVGDFFIGKGRLSRARLHQVFCPFPRHIVVSTVGEAGVRAAAVSIATYENSPRNKIPEAGRSFY